MISLTGSRSDGSRSLNKKDVMRFVEPLSPKAGDGLDSLLRAFYRAEMPNPWPTPCLPVASPLSLGSSTRGRTLMRSRWLLAASAALLLLGSSLLPNRFASDAKQEQGIGGMGTANRNILPDAPKRHEGKPSANKNDPGFGIEDGDLLPELDDSGFSLPK